MTSLWKGYISLFELRKDEGLYLVGYEYPSTDIQSESFEERLTGDFWLVMKPDFYSPRVFVPFVDSLLVSDTSQWIYESRGSS